jgi:DNA-directed RNA polymerase subunit RPC12/RpoP
MTIVTRTRLVCPCGHEGMIVMRENDAPFSMQREDYSLDGLNGSGFSVLDTFAKWDEVFLKMNPTCPKCGSKLNEVNIANP